MKRTQRRRIWYIGGVLLVVLIAAAVVFWFQQNGQKKIDPYVQPETSNEQKSETTTPESSDSTESTDSNASSSTTNPDVSQIDPATIATIDITPMDLTVSYIKGVGGFEYSVQRTADGTKYVEFSSPDLVGTKCTNDNGAFVSIIEKPSNTDTATISKTTTVAGTTYGLSLSGTNCTSNVELLQKYQASFSDVFSLLKKISA